MTTAAWLIIGAVLAGPVIAVLTVRYLDIRREIRSRKLEVFRTLVATRAHTSSWEHLTALNRIDLEFSPDNGKEVAVLEAWARYAELLADSAVPADEWGRRRAELLGELLERMARCLDYRFDRARIMASSSLRLPVPSSHDR